MAWWETEAPPSNEKDRFAYDVARARSRRLGSLAPTPQGLGQGLQPVSPPPSQAQPALVRGGAFTSPQPQIALPLGAEDERLAELAPITPPEAIYTPKAQMLRKHVTGMMPKPWRGTPFHEWVTRGTIGASHRLSKAFEAPTARGTAAPEVQPWEEQYPSAELRQAIARAKPGEFPVAGLEKKPSWIKRGWEKLERETGWADPVGRGIRTFGEAIQEPDRFAKQHLIGAAVAAHPDAEGLSAEQLYPLSESSGSLMFGPLLEALSAPDEDSDSLADLLGRLHDVAFPPGTEFGQGLGPEYVGQVLKRVKGGGFERGRR